MIKLSTSTGEVFFMVFSVDGEKHLATHHDVEAALKHERKLLAIAVLQAQFPTTPTVRDLPIEKKKRSGRRKAQPA